jgi:hypothetical protein
MITFLLGLLTGILITVVFFVVLHLAAILRDDRTLIRWNISGKRKRDIYR